MQFSILAIAALSQVASAHYFFETSALNGAESKPFQYIRDFTRPTKYNPIKFSSNPPADIRDNSFVDGDDIICNQGGSKSGANTEVLEVKGGDVITFKLGVGAKMGHPGPTLAYMSDAGGDVKSYDGSGDWFKIMEEGVCNAGGDFTKDAWCNYDSPTADVKIPQGTPNGEYLLRVEHIGVHRSHVNQPEHYVSCAQVKVTGGSTGKVDAEMTKFPGAYKETDEYANFSIYNGAKAFPMPGPKVWSGSSSAAPAGGDAPATGGDASATTPATGTDAPATTPDAGNNAPVQETPVQEAPVQSEAPAQGGNQGEAPQQGGNQGGFPGAQNSEFQNNSGSNSSPCHA
ncbi:murein transglycosylase [Fusarium avenaceum]|nr:murein transglycosylase [Fusarium avenaceum]